MVCTFLKYLLNVSLFSSNVKCYFGEVWVQPDFFFSLWLNFLCFTFQRPLPLNPVTGLGYVSYGDCADQVTLVSSVNIHSISRFKSHFILGNVLNYILKYLLHCIVLVSLTIPILHVLAFCWLLALTIIFSLILLKSSSLFHSFAFHISIFCFP